MDGPLYKFQVCRRTSYSVRVPHLEDIFSLNTLSRGRHFDIKDGGGGAGRNFEKKHKRCQDLVLRLEIVFTPKRYQF